MYSLILVPLDGSSFAELALPTAVTLATRHDARLHLTAVHTLLTRPLEMQGAPTYDPTYDNDRRRELDAYMARTAARVGGELGRELSWSVVADTPSTAQAISNEAARVGSGLIVLTTHGRGGFSRAWLGSVTSELLRDSAVPTLVVRPDGEAAPPFSLRQILVPLDGSELAAAALEPAVALADPFDASFLIVQVVRTGESLLPYDQTFWTAAEEQAMEEQRVAAQADVDRVVDGMRGRGLKVDGLVVLEPDPARTILRVAAERGVDLVAMSTHGRGGMARLLMGSVTDKVIRGAEHPVLVVRPAE